MTTQTTTSPSASMAKRIKKHSTTHRQFVNDVMESFVIDKRHDHLSPIIENAVRLIVEEANDVRQYYAANSCIGNITAVLDDIYLSYGGVGDAEETNSSLGEMIYLENETDSNGNIKTRGTYCVFDGPEAAKAAKKERDLQRNEPERLRAAIRSANESAVFQTAGVYLILTEDLLVFGGMLHD